MILRIAVIVAVLAGITVLGMPENGVYTAFQPQAAAAAPASAPAATTTSGLQFSTQVTSDARPIDPRVEFDSGINTVWATFEYRDHDPNAKVSYGTRANGSDYNWGRLDCCDGSQGRAAFPVRRRNGGDLPGAAYDVRVYVNDVEVAQGGFGVRGRGGLDNDGQDEDNDND